MELITATAAIVLVNIFAWITPGPNMVAVIAATLGGGRKHGLATGAGLALAATIWATLAIAGAQSLFDLFPRAVLVLKLAGAAYLAWLGVKALVASRAKPTATATATATPRQLSHGFRTGLMVSLTNPKAALFFGSVMTAFVPADAPLWYLALIPPGCGALAIGLHAITATLFATRTAAALFTRFHGAISALFGVTFLTLAASITRDALHPR